MFAGNFAPAGWAFCDGSPMPISENEVLFQLIGTTYGGDGEETFNLPNLQSRVPIHQGNGFNLGEFAGVEEVTLTTNQIPVHTHPLLASTANGTSPDPPNRLLAQVVGGLQPYTQDSPIISLGAQSISPVGGSQPHTNLQPYLAITFIISLFGIYPRAN